MKTQKGKTWKDGSGADIPAYAVNPVLKVEEQWTKRIAKVALAAEKSLKELTELMEKAYSAVFEAKLAQANIYGKEAKNKGSMTLNSFDETVEVKITKPNVTFFDNAMTEIVKEKFQEYFASLSASSEMAIFLKSLIEDLMYTSGGRLDNSKVLKLRKYRSELAENPKLAEKAKPFIEAVDLFDKAIKHKKGNTGIYVSVQEPGSAAKRRVALSYTDVL